MRQKFIRFNEDGTFNDALTNELLSGRLADMEKRLSPDFTEQKKMELSLLSPEEDLTSAGHL